MNIRCSQLGFVRVLNILILNGSTEYRKRNLKSHDYHEEVCLQACIEYLLRSNNLWSIPYTLQLVEKTK